jgi:hypothetical protein
MLKQTMWKVLPAFTLFLAACGAEEPALEKIVEIPAEVEVSLEDQSVTVDEDTTVEVTVKAAVEPADAGAVSLSIDKGPAHGTLTGDAGSYTYAPDPDFNGEDEVQITAKVGDKSAAATIKITVTPVNDAPYFMAGADVNADEDAGPQSIVWASGIAAGPLDELEAVRFNVANDNNALFLVQPHIDDSGTLHFTSVTDANGVANITVAVHDGELSSASETFILTVNPVNDTPSFTAGASQTVLEESGAATIAGWATNISAGPLDESGQSLVFVVSNDNTSLFSAQPTVATNGTLSFTPAANAFGIATVSVAVKDSEEGANSSVLQDFTITITNINDRPSYTQGAATVIVNEDSGQYAQAWAANVSAGPNEAGQALSFSLTLTTLDQAKFASQPTMSSTGVLYFVPAADVFGSANVRVILSDDGGTANGGANQTLEQFFTIQINSVNDAPSMVTGGTVTVLEDSGAYENATWAANLRVGPANEASQTLTRAVTTDNNALFTVQPALSATGALTFTPAADAHGTATVTYTLGDGTLNTTYTSVIEVLPVNDAPSFNVAQTVINLVEDQGAGATLVQSDFITSPSAGPADESGQALSYTVTVNGDNVFALAPTIQTTNLVFSLAENVSGAATLTIIARDDGGTANGGVDSSTAQVYGQRVGRERCADRRQ